jgi:hypothetical protein
MKSGETAAAFSGDEDPRAGEVTMPERWEVCPDCGEGEEAHLDEWGRWVPCPRSVIVGMVGAAYLREVYGL